MVERNADVEEFLNSLPEQQSSIFRYMRDEYEALAERGERFDEAKNDEHVEILASKKFDVTPLEAGNIYATVESRINAFEALRSS